MKRLAFTFLVLAISGCATQSDLVSMTSGAIGCPKSETQISDQDTGWTAYSWTASCRGQRFYCTNSDIAGFSCAKELRPAI